MPSGSAGAGLPLAAALLVVVGALSACSEPDTGGDSPRRPEPDVEPTVDVQHAQQQFHPLMAALADAVAEVSVPARPDGRPETIYYEADLESCVFSSLHYEFDTVFGESVSWDDVRDAAAGVLEPEGFEVTDDLEIPGGHTGFDATTDEGAYVQVRSKLGEPSTISLDAPVAGECDRDVSETLPPLPG